MGFSSTQIGYLKNADQRFAAHVALFPAYSPVVITPNPGNGTALNLKPIPMVSPRYSVVDNAGIITLYATDSYNRGGVYVGNANIAWVNTGAAGTLTDNGDGTATYTAPANGSGTNLITMTATNANGNRSALVYVAYPKTTYDGLVAEIASISGSLSQKGWSVLLRVRGDTSDFTVGKIILLHVDDTWATTTSTFGGYKYSEGVFCGYITELGYYEDYNGERWLGIEAKSSWSKLEQIQLGETMWGTTSRIGRFYRSDFVPVDALWYLLSETTDFTTRHNCTLFYDTNVIDDLVIGAGGDSKTSLATIVDNVMKSGLAISYTDRYSSLLCIPDPDVRSAEWWGTPTPVYDGTNPLTETLCQKYEVNQFDVPRTKRLALIAYDSYRLGMWAAVQASAGTQGDEQIIKGLLCDDTLKLVSWCSEKRAQMNKPWDISVDLPLNHTVDICTPLVAIFTAPTQAGGPTASGLCWIDGVSYRPTWDGGWQGNWHIVKNTQGDTGQNGEVSGWGGSGQWGKNGTGAGIAPSGWGNPSQSSATWLHLFNFFSNTGKFSALPAGNHTLLSGYGGSWITGYGWSGIDNLETTYNTWGPAIDIAQTQSQRVVTGIECWVSASTASFSMAFTTYTTGESGIGNVVIGAGTSHPTFSGIWSSITGVGLLFIHNSNINGTGLAELRLYSARMGGIGTDPFA